MRFAMIVDALVCLALSGTAAAEVYFSTRAPTAVIIDGPSGKILYDKNGATPVPPASMSKLMTAAIVLDEIKRGRISLDTPFRVSEKAWRTGGSKMFVLVDTDIRVEDLLKGLLVQSGNDAAVVLAENIAGSEEDFVRLMNEKATAWGLTQSRFANPMGNDDPAQMMSALDIARLARKIWNDYPEQRYLFGLPSFTWSEIEQLNRNPVLRSVRGADGMKTGYTEAAGWSLVGTAEQNGERRLIVLAGLDSDGDRAREATRMMDLAFSEYATRTFFTAGDIIGQAEVFGGRTDTIPLMIDTTVTHTLHKQQIARAEAVMTYTGPLRAPVRKGDQVAILKLTIPDDGTTEFPLYAAETARELGVLAKIGLGVTLLFTPPSENAAP